MKVLLKPVEVIAWFTREGLPIPLRLRVEQADGSRTVIKNIRTIKRKQEKLAGNPTMIFTCHSIIHEKEMLFELRYEVRNCKWYIYKI